MVTIKKSLQLLTAALFALMPLVSSAETPVVSAHDSLQTVTTETAHEVHAEVHAEETDKEFVHKFTQHHLIDDHFYSFYADKEAHRHYGFALPVILIDYGLIVFMSSEDF